MYLAVGLFAALAVPAAAQDAKTVVAAASKAMGADNLSSLTMYGSGANFGLGQSNNSNGAWPRTNVNDYVRSIDFTQPASRATGVTFAAPVTGGPAVQGAFQQNITPANNAWAQQLEIWITPWGFLKGAAANNATVKSQTIGGKKYNVVTWMTTQKAPSGISYKVVGYINDQNLVEKVETWLENPIFGDMLVEALYTDYRDANGLKYPADDRAEARRIGDLRGADSGRQRQSQEHRAVGDASCRRSARRPAGREPRLAAAAAPRRRNSPTASIASTARTTPWRSSSRITSFFSRADRRTKRDRWRSSPKPRR